MLKQVAKLLTIVGLHVLYNLGVWIQHRDIFQHCIVKWEDLHHLLDNSNVEVKHTLENPRSCSVTQVIITVCQHSPHSYANSEDVVVQICQKKTPLSDL